MRQAQLLWLLTAFVCSLCLCQVAFGQSNFATLTGTVTDSSGAAVTHASVEAVNQSTNFRYTSLSDDAGNYLMVNLLEGVYRVKVTAPGFQDSVVESLALASRATQRIDVKLQVGQVATTVEVSSAAGLIETETAKISDVKERETLQALPMTLRRIHDTWAVQPAAFSGRLGGSRAKQSDFSLDGVTLSSTSGGATTGVMTDRTEAFAEVRIDVAGNSAEYAGVGQVAITTRAGTNQIHGSAFDIYQSPRLISRTPFSQVGTGSIEHDPGWSFGGPVYLPKIYDGRNRTFFFTSWEVERLGAPNRNNRQLSVPLESWRKGDFSALLPGTPVRDPFAGNTPFPGNLIPTVRLNPIALKMQERYPLPNVTPSVFQAQNYLELQLTPKHIDPTWTGRLDQRISDKTFLYARLTDIYWHQDGRDSNGLAYYGWTSAFRHDQAWNVNFTHIFRPGLLAEIRWGLAYDTTPSQGSIRGQQEVKLLGLTGLAPGLPDTPGSFAVSFTGAVGLTGLSSTGISEPYNRKQHFQGNVSWFVRRHSMKLGYDIGAGIIRSYSEGGALFGSQSFSNKYTNFAYADFLLGIPTTASRDFPASHSTQRGHDFAFFVTDEYKVNPKLTLTYGLRYELKPGYTSEQGQMAMFDIGSGKIVVPDGQTRQVSALMPVGYVGVVEASSLGLPGDTLIRTDRNNFAPRLGFAYRPWGNRTVFRGGAGIYYDFTPRGLSFASVPFRLAEPSFTNTTTNPIVLPQVSGSVAGPTTVTIPNAVNPNIVIPYSMQYNFAIEHQRWDIGWRISYIGTNTRQGVWAYDYNQPIANNQSYIGKPRPFSNYPSVNYVTNGAGHQFNSLVLEAERASKNGFYWQAYFSLARDIGDLDDGGSPEDAFNRKREKAVIIDIPKYRFNYNTVYALPFGKGKKLSPSNRIANALVSTWSLSAIYTYQAGQFLTPSWTGPDPTGTRFTASSTAPSVTIRPNQLANPNIDNPTSSKWFEPAAFGAPSPGSFGSSAKGVIVGPDWNILHASLIKYIVITERLRLKVGCTTSNVLNHPSYSNPALNISTTTTVARITSVRGLGDIDKGQPRIFQLTARLDW